MFIASLIINCLAHLRQKTCKLRKDFVGKEERNIVFGNQKTWVDVETRRLSTRGTSPRILLCNTWSSKRTKPSCGSSGGGCHAAWPSSYFGPAEVDPQKGTRARCYPENRVEHHRERISLGSQGHPSYRFSKSYKAKVRGFARQSGTLQEAGEGEWQVQVVEPQICRYRYPTRSLALRRN